VPSKVGLGQRQPLHHGAHRAVQNQDPLLQLGLQQVS
jgi:hypothetical protein